MPSTRRCVFGCDTAGVTIHNFPNPKTSQERFQIWVGLAGASVSGMSNLQIFNNRKVCDKHFEEKDKNRNNRLNALAIPHLHVPMMGKRKRYDEEEYLAHFVKKLSRVRANERRYDSTSSDLEQNQYSDSDNYLEESLQEASQNKGGYEVIVLTDSTTHPKPPDEPTSAPTAFSASADALAQENASTESIQELDPDILCLLGQNPAQEETFGQNVHKDIANSWTDILVNGLKDETKNNILKTYSVPYNLKMAQAPTLNPEIRAAVNEDALKRDNILSQKQKVLSSIITCVANTITAVLQTGSCDEEIKCQTVKYLNDAGRLLCQTHYSETQTRRNLLLSCLNKEIKDNVKGLKRDHLLFGNDLKDN